jgi:hypothetical protein
MHRETATRRKFIATGGAGAAGIVGLAAVSQARGAELGATEKANVEVVEAFDKNMSDPAPNLDKLDRMKETCSEDIIWGTAGGMKLHGLPAVAEWYTNFFKGPKKGEGGLRTIEYEYSETFAHGPVVVMYGLHFVTPPGGPKPAPNNFHCVVHVVKNGKIIERYDYSVR